MKLRDYLFMTLLIVLAMSFHGYSLLTSPYANGWDGYYYVMQIHSIWEYGTMQSPDYSLIYPWYLFWSLFTDDYIFATQLGGLALIGLFTFSVMFLSYRWSKSFQALFVSGAICCMSPALTFMGTQYPKNLLGIIILLWFVDALRNRNWVRQAILLLIVVFVHRITAGLVFLIIPFFLYSRYKKCMLKIMIALSITLPLVMMLFPGLIHWSDLQRFSGSFSAMPSLAHTSFMSVWGWELHPSWWIEAVIHLLGLGLIIRGFVLKKLKFDFNHPMTALLICSLVLLFPFFSWFGGSMGYRFYLSGLLFTPLFFGTQLKELKQPFVIGFGVLAIALAMLSMGAYDREKFDPDWDEYHAVSKTTIKTLEKEQVDLVICHRGIAELIIIHSKTDALNWIPDYDTSGMNVWRLAGGVRRFQMKEYLNEDQMEKVFRVGADYYLMPESIWKKLDHEIHEKGTLKLMKITRSWRNPYEVRPTFLGRNKSKIKD